MFTELGRFLRKLRIDNDEILRDMAEKIGVTSSYLSAIECGKRNIPSDFIEKISSLYSLDANQKSEFEAARDLTIKDISINLTDASCQKRDLALQFARTFDDMDEQTTQALLDFLNKGKQ